MFYQFRSIQRTGEGSLHPRPEGRGIRDPPRSRCNKGGSEREAVKGSQETTQIILIRGGLEQMGSIQRRIDELEREIKNRVANRREDLRIAMSIPGIGFTSAATILAEVGDFNDLVCKE
jgi:transposase